MTVLDGIEQRWFLSMAASIGTRGGPGLLGAVAGGQLAAMGLVAFGSDERGEAEVHAT